MTTLETICTKFNVKLQPDTEHRQNGQKLPLEIPLTRAGLASLFHELEMTTGAEIGVESGIYSEVLLQANPNLKLYSVDAWKAYRDYREHVTQEKIDGFFEATKQKLSQFGKRSEIVRAFSADAAKNIEKESLDFVYIDGNHAFEYVVADLAAWVPKVRKGGIISGHDYFRSKSGPYHVVHAVWGWTQAYNVKPWFVARGDHTASWLWVK